MESVSHVYHSIIASKYYQLASIVILFYDFILTLDVEVEEIWGAALRPAVVLFLTNRYIPLITYSWIIAAYHETSWSESKCQSFLHFPTIAVVLSECVISAIVIYRIRALYERMTFVITSMSLLAIFQCISGAVASANVSLFDPELAGGCFVTVKQHKQIFFAIWWGTGVLFDASAFALKLNHHIRSRWLKKDVMLHTPLLDLFFRDGSIYFAVMSIAKIVNFVVFWTISKDFILVNWTFNNTITVVMISRVFLNLRSFNKDGFNPQNEQTSLDSIMFAPISSSTAKQMFSVGDSIQVDWLDFRNSQHIVA